jgi:hypothetical protein
MLRVYLGASSLYCLSLLIAFSYPKTLKLNFDLHQKLYSAFSKDQPGPVGATI